MQWLLINVTYQILYNRGQFGHVLEQEEEVEEGEEERKKSKKKKKKKRTMK